MREGYSKLTCDVVHSSLVRDSAVSARSALLIAFKILHSFLCWSSQSRDWQYLPQYHTRLHPPHLANVSPGSKHRKQRWPLIARCVSAKLKVLCRAWTSSRFITLDAGSRDMTKDLKGADPRQLFLAGRTILTTREFAGVDASFETASCLLALSKNVYPSLPAFPKMIENSQRQNKIYSYILNRIFLFWQVQSRSDAAKLRGGQQGQPELIDQPTYLTTTHEEFASCWLKRIWQPKRVWVKDI